MDRFSVDDGNTHISLSAWQALGYDTHSIIAIPAQLFVNPAIADYHLTSNSPAVDHGLMLQQVLNDLEGNPRRGATPMISALTSSSSLSRTVISCTCQVLCHSAPDVSASLFSLRAAIRHPTKTPRSHPDPTPFSLTDALNNSAAGGASSKPPDAKAGVDLSLV